MLNEFVAAHANKEEHKHRRCSGCGQNSPAIRSTRFVSECLAHCYDLGLTLCSFTAFLFVREPFGFCLPGFGFQLLSLSLFLLPPLGLQPSCLFVGLLPDCLFSSPA